MIKTEGTKSAEKIYFNNFNSRNSRIKFATGNSTDVSGMLDDLINYMEMNDISVRYGDKIFFVIDTDLDDKRICDIKKVQKKCISYGIKIITSAPTFEIWYLMHFRSNNLNFKSSSDVKKEIKKLIPNYKETKNIYEMIGDKTNTAIENAKLIEKRYKDIVKDMYSFAPHSYVYLIIEEIKKNNN